MRPGIFFLGLTLGLAGPLSAQRDLLDSLARRARTDSTDPVAQFELGRALLEAGRLDAADTVLHAAVRLAPQYADAWLALGVLPDRRGEGYWKKVRKARGDSALLNAWQESQSCMRRAFLHDPLVSLSLLPRAEESFSVRIDSYTLFVWWRPPLGKALNALREEKYEVAAAQLDKMFADPRAGPDGAALPDAALWYRGLASAHLKKFDLATRDFWLLVQRGLRQEQQSPEAAVPMRTNEYRYMLATALYLGGRYDDAIMMFKRTLEHDAGLYQSYVQMARMYEQLDRWEDALAARKAAIAINPDDAGLLIDLAATLLRMGRFREGVEQLHLAAGLAPLDPRSAYLEGLAQLQLEDTTAARAAFTRFLGVATSRYGEQIAEVRGRLETLH